jgi:hypothetical protein
MPQGRNGMSQESVDDILLILSQRDIIDFDQMPQYLHRLSEEWIEGGARERILNLLRSHEGQLQSVAMHVLTKLATESDLDYLEDFVTDPTVSDMSKLSLAPILKLLDSEMAEDGLLEYLNDAAGAIRQMQSHLLELAGKSMLGIETILNDFRMTMSEERQLGFITWLGNSGDPRAVHVLIPLLDLTISKLVGAVIESLEQLGPLAVSSSIPALQRFIGFTNNRQLKDLAHAVIQHLAEQSQIEADEFAMLNARHHFEQYEARVSPLDGAGNQLVMLSWLRPDRLLQGINLLINAGYGLKDCYSIDEINEEQWQSLTTDFQEHGYNSHKVPFEYARALAIEAYGQKKRARSHLPLTYSLWRRHIEGNDSREKKKKLVSSLVAVKQISLTKLGISYAIDGEELFDLPEFTSWFYDPMEPLIPYINRYMAMLPQNFDVAQPGQLQLSRQQELDLAVGLDQLVKEAMEHLIDAKWRLTYESLLRRQAAFYQQIERDRVGQVIQGIAAALHPASSMPLQEQTFPQALLRISIKHGPLRLMLESLRAKKAKAPFSPF